MDREESGLWYPFISDGGLEELDSFFVRLFLGERKGGAIGDGCECCCAGGGCGSEAVEGGLDFRVLICGGSGKLLKRGVAVGGH